MLVNLLQDLVAYASKRVSEAAKNYCVRLDIVWSSYNVASFSDLLRKVDFDAIVDHLGLTPLIRVRQNQPK